MKGLKYLSFGGAAVLVLVLMAATVLEKLRGTAFALEAVYASPWFVGLWAVVAVASAVYVGRRLHRRVSTFVLHVSFLLILAGALVTHLSGQQGSVHLRQDAPAPLRTFTSAGGGEEPLPFGLSLREFRLEYYPGTTAPMDFVSRFTVTEADGTSREGEVSMNRIFRHRHYRFYQARYDSDGRGATLSVAYDPWGIGITYAGYALLLLACILFFFDRRSEFRRLWHHPLLRGAAVCACLCALSLPLSAAASSDAPRALPRETAAAFGRLYVYYNDRICPLQTLAKDFTVKLCGKPSYKGLTPEQVLTGWFFYYDDWKAEPVIRIRSAAVRFRLGIEGRYACLTDFVGREGYKLDEDVLQRASAQERHALEEANEQFSLVSQVAAGSIWRLYPFVEEADSLPGGQHLTWLSLADRPPRAMPLDEQSFVRGSMNYVAEQVARKDFAQVEHLVGKIRTYQERAAAGYLPSSLRFRAEMLYNRLNNSRPLAIASVTIGLLAFVYYCRRLVLRRRGQTWVSRGLAVLLLVELLFLCTTMTLRGLASGHLPLSNGHETMQLLAACALLLAWFFRRRLPLSVSFGFLLGGLALLVSMMGEANPQVSHLMPVLSSPLLSFHVVVIMLAYALLAFVMLNGVTALVVHLTARGEDSRTEVERLQVLSRLLLYPAVFLLAVGIFIGAVWANVSWGRYWGWDPKEVWALVTLLVYAFALHSASLPWFRRPLFFHVFAVLAFLCVLVTYFGVNFLLGGMHSYA